MSERKLPHVTLTDTSRHLLEKVKLHEEILLQKLVIYRHDLGPVDDESFLDTQIANVKKMLADATEALQ